MRSIQPINRCFPRQTRNDSSYAHVITAANFSPIYINTVETVTPEAIGLL